MDIPVSNWIKSRSCNRNACVEVASIPAGVAIRNSNQPDGPIVVFSLSEFEEFMTGVRNGDFDGISPAGPPA